MKPVTLAQMHQFQEMVIRKEVPSERFQTHLDQGIFADLLEAEISNIPRPAFRKALRLPLYKCLRIERVIPERPHSLKSIQRLVLEADPTMKDYGRELEGFLTSYIPPSRHSYRRDPYTLGFLDVGYRVSRYELSLILQEIDAFTANSWEVLLYLVQKRLNVHSFRQLCIVEEHRVVCFPPLQEIEVSTRRESDDKKFFGGGNVIPLILRNAEVEKRKS